METFFILTVHFVEASVKPPIKAEAKKSIVVKGKYLIAIKIYQGPSTIRF